MRDKKINVVSLFNGMNTGRQALENVGIKVNKYYSSEIKPYAIELTQHHFSDTIQVGDVTKWREWDIDWSSIDLILSGSPCQDLSAAGKRAGINGSRSSLFFVFVEIRNHINTERKKIGKNDVIFFQENVGSAMKLDIGIMSRELGLYPVRINSSLMTAQLRDRYYWTNIRTTETMFDTITDIPQPKDKGIMFKDIITGGTVERVKALALLESESRVVKSQQGIKKRAAKDFINMIYIDTDKHTCLNTGSGRDNCSQRYLKHRNKTTGMLTLIQEADKVRTVNKIEMCRLQGFPDNYCDILSTAKAGSLLGDGWTLPIVEHIFSFML
ncbi:Dcm Site-specific DNA methylase [uncultured Caudovirales phage]|uniref:DNA (cytosine-5-)-methyltransferase n=4 Tax=uncultured Caudovirales phage TaxID=2100421 RepID=A0A6J5SYU2_9CAUD|nr:Dcm Site-specific DNA methylase [uncultured Caudovirales phage]CAB4220575.1 Dcm Site-specific DNA methylase [uncultured Caudovirales phage]